MRRRKLVANLALGALVGPAVLAGGTRSVPQTLPDAVFLPTPFHAATVPGLARALSEQPHRPRNEPLPSFLAELDYDGYRQLRFDRRQALWSDSELPFQMQPHPRGFLFKDRVDLFEVACGVAVRLRYRSEQFSLDGKPLPEVAGELGFAGFKLLCPLNRADHFDELCSFLGASYFRALSRGHVYGLSARGLAIGTADPAGEEFPAFTAFWIERPRPGDRDAVVHALLESASLTGAYRFAITPGETTTMAVTATLFPRRNVPRVGIAPATSMFFFAPQDRRGVNDWRNAVHDSDGLILRTGHGEQLWRPLANPAELQVSGFQDDNPQGFGLMQRARAYPDYNDLEAAYHRRPGLWVEPLDPWGRGEVMLVEIPTRSEIHDNIAAAWAPRGGLRAGVPMSLRYRLHWPGADPGDARLLRFVATRIGGSDRNRTLRVVLDTSPLSTVDAVLPEVELWSGAGIVANAVVQPNPETGGLRLAFELRPDGARLVELRARLTRAGKPVSESWVWRWTA